MVNLLNFVDYRAPISWNEADALAMGLGQRLFADDHQDRGDVAALSQIGGVFKETSKWIGVSALPEGGYVYSSGATVVDFLQFYNSSQTPPIDPNADGDPSNDIVHPVLEDKYWRSPNPDLGPVTQLVVEYANGQSFVGTNRDDYFMGPLRPGQVVLAGDGDDVYRGRGGGQLVMGSGHDNVDSTAFEDASVWFTAAGGPTDIHDGPGSDYVYMPGGDVTIHAAIDGDGDDFQWATRLSYGADAAGVSNARPNPGVFHGAGIGEDIVGTMSEIIGGDGDDYIVGFPRLYGGRGDDYLKPQLRDDPSVRLFADGQDGDDTLVADAGDGSRVELRGGNGSDTLVFFSGASCSGGKGDDQFVFMSTNLQVTINDLSLGDQIDLSALLTVTPLQAFGGGYLKTEARNGYTNVLIDTDGGGDNYTALFSLKGVYQNVRDYIISGDTFGGPPVPRAYGLVFADTGDGFTFDQAVAKAQGLGFAVAHVNSPDEAAFIAKALAGGFVHGYQPWIADPTVYSAYAPGFPDADLNDHTVFDPAGWRDNATTNTAILVQYDTAGPWVGSAQTDAFYGRAASVFDGLAGRDYIFGSAFNDSLVGGEGSDVLIGGEGGDALYGDGTYRAFPSVGADDYIDGGKGDDRLVGGPGADRLIGGAGNDTAVYLAAAGVALEDSSLNWGEALGDYLSGIENLVGSDQNDQLSGDANANTIIGFNGDDIITSRGGDDFIESGEGDDTIDGGAGNDWIDGLDGDDVLTGGAGADRFIFRNVGLPDEEGRNGWGHDTIVDFEHGQDRIEFTSGFFKPTFADLEFTQSGTSVEIHATSDPYGNAIVVLDSLIADFRQEDFGF